MTSLDTSDTSMQNSTHQSQTMPRTSDSCRTHDQDGVPKTGDIHGTTHQSQTMPRTSDSCRTHDQDGVPKTGESHGTTNQTRVPRTSERCRAPNQAKVHRTSNYGRTPSGYVSPAVALRRQSKVDMVRDQCKGLEVMVKKCDPAWIKTRDIRKHFDIWGREANWIE